ncbi:MAG: HAMP domain-containing sensor histidine kinase [Eubacteriales bacterium]|nr:HAMP domain-containing sensor histidine kinase [Eubacteriales bacterium]
MFKKSRYKIVAAIMSVLVFLFIGTLTLIYTLSYYEVENTNYELLEHHAQMYVLNDPMINNQSKELPKEFMESLKKDEHKKPFDKDHSFELSIFYSVAIADDGQILDIDVGKQDKYDKKTLQSYALDILESGNTQGSIDDLAYFVEPKQGYTLVAFMDNTIVKHNMGTLFRYTLVFGSVALVALFFVAIYLAKRIVKPLEESYQKQKQFISDAGHELKTPVSVVSANAELLSREIGDNKWLSNIQFENERMGDIISQLLNLAKTEDTTILKESLNLSRLVAGGALPFESVAFEKGLTLVTKINDDITIIGNNSQLSQLVSILVDNAIRHSTNGKEIEIVLTESRGHANLSVINASDPIPRETREKLFERFYRVDEARNSEDNHYGLGLAIAKAIVTAHNGKISVNCKDNKVCFTARIPKS